MIRLIGMDADDTLWDNEIIYVRAKRQFVGLLGQRIDPREGEEHLSRVETANVPRFGYGIRSFTLSMVQAAAELLEGDLTSRHVNEILEIADSMLSTPVHLLPGARDVLEALASSHRLVLITKGDSFEQDRKIRHSGVRGFFGRVEVVIDKSLATYRSLLSEEAVAPEEFLMAGNSLRSDILPVLEIGAYAVYVPYEGTWEHEQAASEPIGARRYHRISSLRDLPSFVSRLSSTA
jgi:putative hydrolase of the HAD superfamily